MVVQGAMDVVWGAAKTSRSPTIENVVLRVLGVALIIGGLLLPLRQSPVYWLGALLLVLGAVETLVFSPFQTYSEFERLGTVVIVLLLFLLPATILVFLALQYG